MNPINFGFGYPHSPESTEGETPAPFGGNMPQGSFLPMNGYGVNGGDNAIMDDAPAPAPAPATAAAAAESFPLNTQGTANTPPLFSPPYSPNPSGAILTSSLSHGFPEFDTVPKNNPHGILILNPLRYSELPGAPRSQPVAPSAAPSTVPMPTMQGSVPVVEPSDPPRNRDSPSPDGKHALNYVTLPPYDQNVYVCETCEVELNGYSAEHKPHKVYWRCPFCYKDHREDPKCWKFAPRGRSNHLQVHMKEGSKYAKYVKELRKKKKKN